MAMFLSFHYLLQDLRRTRFNITLPLINSAMMAVCYGDLFMRLLYRTRPYEKVPVPPTGCIKWNERLRVCT